MTKTAEDFDKRAKEIAYKVSCSLLHIPVKQVKGCGPVMAKNYAEEIEKALKLYALKQMGPLVEAIKKAGRCTECGGTLKTNKTEKCIAMWQMDCWKCRLSGLESWAVEALTHYTSLKEEMK